MQQLVRREGEAGGHRDLGAFGGHMTDSHCGSTVQMGNEQVMLNDPTD